MIHTLFILHWSSLGKFPWFSPGVTRCRAALGIFCSRTMCCALLLCALVENPGKSMGNPLETEDVHGKIFVDGKCSSKSLATWPDMTRWYIIGLFCWWRRQAWLNWTMGDWISQQDLSWRHSLLPPKEQLVFPHSAPLRFIGHRKLLDKGDLIQEVAISASNLPPSSTPRHNSRSLFYLEQLHRRYSRLWLHIRHFPESLHKHLMLPVLSQVQWSIRCAANK